MFDVHDTEDSGLGTGLWRKNLSVRIGNLAVLRGWITTVEPLIMDTLKSGQPPYNGHTVHPLPIYCPYISTSEEGTISEQWTNTRPQHVHYSEVPLYKHFLCAHCLVFNIPILSSISFFHLFLSRQIVKQLW